MIQYSHDVQQDFLQSSLAATVYSQTLYIDNLPAVELGPRGSSAGDKVPRDYLHQLSDGTWKLDTVEQVPGPWGNKYIIREIRASNPIPMEDDRIVRVFEMMGNNNPLVARCSAETYDGMEVRIVLEKVEG